MMLIDFPLFPQQASSFAGDVDALFIFLTVLTGTVSLAIFVVIFVLAIKYRRTADNQIPQEYEPPKMLEVIWIVVPAAIFMGLFVWGSWLYFHLARVPDNALDIYATGKQWMWKFQHPSGQREINTLHVPVNRPIRITMASEDVIHSLFFPAFRVKADVLPNRYRTMWFKATKTGRYHIFCAEYCGTSHSGMIGWVEVMDQPDYQRWLAGGAEGSLASQGEKLFQKYACNTCHTNDATGRGPVLVGVFGSTVTLNDNTTVKADENYIRESILNPTAKIVRGYTPLMPTFQGQVNEDDLIKLLAYVKSLGQTRSPVNPVESQQSFQTNAGSPYNPGAGVTPQAPPKLPGGTNTPATQPKTGQPPSRPATTTAPAATTT